MVGAMLAGTVSLASPASAASPTCNTLSKWDSSPRNVGMIQNYTFTSPTVGEGNIFCVLREGMSGPRVLILQRALNVCYSKTGLESGGYYGPRTREAVRQVQEFEAAHYQTPLVQDGIFGGATHVNMAWPIDQNRGRPCDYPFVLRYITHLHSTY
jgi:hypothetical protein